MVRLRSPQVKKAGLAIFILAACFIGSAGKFSLWSKAYKAQQEGKFEQCAELYGQAAQVSLKEAAKRKPGSLKRTDAVHWAAVCFFGQTTCLKKIGRKEDEKNSLTQCVDLNTQAIAGYEVLLKSPMSATDHERATGWLGGAYGGRAHCRKELGQLAGAIEDKESEIKHANEICHGDWPLGTKKIGQTVCNSVADNVETLAKWKKELGIKEVKP